MNHTTSSRQEWLLRLKQNVSSYLSLLTNYTPESILKISKYRYLIDIDLNIEGIQENDIRNLMFAAEFIIQSNIDSDRGKRLKHYTNKNYTILNSKTVNCIKNNYEAFLNYLLLKFEIFFKVEWERIKAEVSNPNFQFDKTNTFKQIESHPTIAKKLQYYKNIFICFANKK